MQRQKKQQQQKKKKRNILIEANIMSNSYSPYIFRGVDFSRKVNLSVAMATNQIDRVCLVEDHSTNISVKRLSKYLQ